MEAGFEHLKEAFADVMSKIVEFPRGVLVTVLGAKITANTRHAKIILSVFPNDQETEALRVLIRMDHEIKELLAERLRLRRIPSLHYSFDESGEAVSRIDEDLNRLRQKGEL